VSKSREFKFTRLTDEDFEHVSALRKLPVIESLKRSKTRSKSRKKGKVSNDKNSLNGVYQGKVIVKKKLGLSKSLSLGKGKRYRHGTVMIDST